MYERSYDIGAARRSTQTNGKAVEKSETKVHKLSEGDWYTDYAYYKEITIEVLEILKGDMDTATFTYFEAGGETEDVIYIENHQEPVKLGKEYIFFLNHCNPLLFDYFRFVSRIRCSGSLLSQLAPL